MEFRDLKKQYSVLKEEIDKNMQEVITDANFISGRQVKELEEQLADYVGVKHCVSCANGTDALTLALMVLNVSEGDAVFIPDFTFFSTGEVVSYEGATPIFVDVDQSTYNMDSIKLEQAIQTVIKEGKLNPKVIIPVDLFGLPSNYPEINKIAKKYNLIVLEDAAQGFGGKIGDQRACSFGDIATTSFFPAKPLGCYGDGGAIFTNNDEWASLLESYRVHGKGTFKYDNIRIGMNSRLDTIQAAVLKVKLKAFDEHELEQVNLVAKQYDNLLTGVVRIPVIPEGFYSSWAQYTIQLSSKDKRDDLQKELKAEGIPTMIYYPKPMHRQDAFMMKNVNEDSYAITNQLCDTVLALPMHPYMEQKDVEMICALIRKLV